MLNASARTHTGRVRPQNEDAALCRAEHGVFAVIDGMGGEEAGEVAAAIAASAFAEIPNTRRLPSETVLATAFREARDRILRQGESNPAHKDMGAVATAIRFEDNGRAIGLAHVGDTRAWLVGAKGVRQLTHDHVQRVEGSAKPAVARDLGRREMQPDWIETARFPVARGDLLVLASDGLHDPVPEPELVEELKRMWRDNLDADAVSARLVALALARGGPDNVTVVAVRVGRFHRARTRGRRLGMAVSLIVFLMLLATVAVPLLRPDAPVPDAPIVVPPRIAETFAIGKPVAVSVPAGTSTVIAAGGNFALRGADVSGVDWTIEVGEGALLTMAHSTVRLDASLTILLAKGASLTMTDSRVEAGAIRVVGVEETVATLRHTTLRATATAGPVFEGPIGRAEEEVRILGAAELEAPAVPADGADPGGMKVEGTSP